MLKGNHQESQQFKRQVNWDQKTYKENSLFVTGINKNQQVFKRKSIRVKRVKRTSFDIKRFKVQLQTTVALFYLSFLLVPALCVHSPVWTRLCPGTGVLKWERHDDWIAILGRDHDKWRREQTPFMHLYIILCETFIRRKLVSYEGFLSCL